VLTRPAIEAGERLGFLPGTMEDKVSPYLRPLYDALHDMLDFDRAQQLMERGILEIAPLAFMRGRTLNDSFVILDEAQNTTNEQMKMFLTRLGSNRRRWSPATSRRSICRIVGALGLPRLNPCLRTSRAFPSATSPRSMWFAIPWWRGSSAPTNAGAPRTMLIRVVGHVLRSKLGTEQSIDRRVQ